MRISRAMFWTLACMLPVSFVLTLASGMLFFAPPLIQFVGVMFWLSNAALLSAATCAYAFEAGRWRALMVAGIAASAGALISWGVVLWTVIVGWSAVEPLRNPSAMEVIAATSLTTLAIYSGMAGILVSVRLVDAPSRFLRVGILVLGAVAALHTSAAVGAYPMLDLHGRAAERYIETHVRWNGIWVVLIAVGVLGCVGSYYYRKFRKGSESITPPKPVPLTCPRCALAQVLHTEGDACARCGLRINVRMVSAG